MKTYWQFEIKVGARCVMSAAQDTLSKAMQTAFRDAIYYKAVYPSETITIATIREHCAGCFNLGSVNVRKSIRCKVRVIRCPECRGVKATGTLDDIALEMPDAANRISLVQSA